MISSLRVQNFKCLRDVTIPLQPLTVLVGKNDTGKSSVLQALELLRSVIDLRPGQRPELPGQLETYVWGRDTSLTIRLQASFSGGSYTLGLNTGVPGRPFELVEERAEIPEGDLVRVFRSRNPNPRVEWVERNGSRSSLVPHEIDPSQTALAMADRRGPWPPPLSSLRDKLVRSATYRLRPEALVKPSPLTSMPRLSEAGEGLPSLLDHILVTNRRGFSKLEEELRQIAPGIAEVQPRTIPDQQGKGLWYRLTGTDFVIPATSASEGILMATAFLALVYQDQPPTRLLLEEPENAIHPRQLELLVRHLRALSTRSESGVQVIATTHSPYLLDFVPPESVVVLGRRPTGETVAHRLADLPGVEERRRDGMTLGEIWFNVGEDRLLKDVLSAPAPG